MAAKYERERALVELLMHRRGLVAESFIDPADRLIERVCIYAVHYSFPIIERRNVLIATSSPEIAGRWVTISCLSRRPSAFDGDTIGCAYGLLDEPTGADRLSRF